MSRTDKEAEFVSDKWFPTDTEGLAQATKPVALRLKDGDHYDLRITPVSKQINDATVRMLAYSGSIPGPTLLVKQGLYGHSDDHQRW